MPRDAEVSPPHSYMTVGIMTYRPSEWALPQESCDFLSYEAHAPMAVSLSSDMFHFQNHTRHSGIANVMAGLLLLAL